MLDSVQQDGDLQEERNQRFSVTLKVETINHFVMLIFLLVWMCTRICIDWPRTIAEADWLHWDSCSFRKQHLCLSCVCLPPKFGKNDNGVIFLFLYLIFLVFHVLHVVEFLWLQLVDSVPHILSPLPLKHKRKYTVNTVLKSNFYDIKCSSFIASAL